MATFPIYVETSFQIHRTNFLTWSSRVVPNNFFNENLWQLELIRMFLVARKLNQIFYSSIIVLYVNMNTDISQQD